MITIGKHIEDKNSVKYYAQELKENTYNLTRMNLVMRGIIPDNIDTRCADSLDQDWPIFTDGAEIGKPLYVDAVVSNPPYSQEWSANDRELDPRFKEYGVAPKSKADYAFLLHELHHLKPDGILTIVLPHGVLFRGDALKDADGEGKIRRNLIERNNIDAIIGLPANIFFGTGIPTLIMVLKQHRDNDDVLIIDASKGFVKDGKSNKLRACDVRRIADCIRDRKTIAGYARVVSRDEIRENGYNLNIPRYVDSSEAAEQFDIYATVFGGIPQSEIDGLSRYWDALPSLRAQLFANKADGSPYADVAVNDLTAAIEANADVVALKAKFASAFADFQQVLHVRLIDSYDSVKDMAELDAISQDIFARLHGMELVDPYRVYQVLADQWQGIMGDIEILQTEGFDAVRMVEQAYKMKKDAKTGEEMEVPDGMKGRIMPFDLIQQTYFQAELEAIIRLKRRQEDIVSELDEIREALSTDPMQEKTSNITTYAYCINNPVAYIDHDGKFSKKWMANISRTWYNLWHKQKAGPIIENKDATTSKFKYTYHTYSVNNGEFAITSHYKFDTTASQRVQDIGDGISLAGYATTLSVVGAEVGVPMSVIGNTISSVGSAGELVLDFANGDMGDGLKGGAFRLLEKGTEKVLNKFLPGFGKKIGEEGFNLGTEIIDQGRKLKQSGVERLTDIVIEKKSKKITKVRIKMNNVWYIYCGGVCTSY